MKPNLILLLQLLPVIRKVSGSVLRMSAHRTLVYNTRISQGSVATRLSCGGNFTNSFIANCPQSVTVKELNRSIFGEDIDVSLVAGFYGPRCTKCITINVHACLL